MTPSTFRRVRASLDRDLRYLRHPDVGMRDRVALTAYKYAARARRGESPIAVRFAGRIYRGAAPTDPALLQRVVTETRESLDLFGLRHQRGLTCIDVGAHHGETSLAWLLCLDAPSIVAFEPNPVSANLACANLAGSTATVHAVGLSDAPSDALLDVSGGNGGDASFVGARDGAAVTRVPVVRGDDVLDGVCPDLLKIDVEGYELHVLAGLDGTLSRTRFLTLELSLGRPKDHSFHEVAAVLAAHRFELIAAGEPHHGADGAQTAIDLHFRRSDAANRG